MTDMLIKNGQISEATICYPLCKCERHDNSMRFQAIVYGVIDGVETELLQFFHDELYFSSTEFIGLTKSEALDLFHTKDIAYLRS